MSMYNLLFGKNPLSDIVLATLGLTQGECGRFRDCFIAEGEIAVYTRLGGGNRECYCTEKEEKEGHSGCYRSYIEGLQAHPNYLRDNDDDFDSTYATFYFSFPDSYRTILEALGGDEPFDSNKRWQTKLTELEQSSAEELKAKYPELIAVMEQIVRKLT